MCVLSGGGCRDNLLLFSRRGVSTGGIKRRHWGAHFCTASTYNAPPFPSVTHTRTHNHAHKHVHVDTRVCVCRCACE